MVSGYKLRRGGGDTGLFSKHRGEGREKRAETEGEFRCSDFSGTSYLTWRICRFLCCGGGNGWSWAVAKHVSPSVHSSLLFLSVCSPPTLPLTLLPEFCSKVWERPSAPGLGQERGEGNSTLSSLVVVVVGVHRARRCPFSQGNDQVQSSSTLSNTNTNMSLSSFQADCSQSTGLTSSSVTQGPPCLTLWLALCLSLFSSDLLGHISPGSLVCASFAGRVLALGLGQVERFLSTGATKRRSWFSLQTSQSRGLTIVPCCGCAKIYFNYYITVFTSSKFSRTELQMVLVLHLNISI